MLLLAMAHHGIGNPSNFITEDPYFEDISGYLSDPNKVVQHAWFYLKSF